MARRAKKAPDQDEGSLSEDIDDYTEESIEAQNPSLRNEHLVSWVDKYTPRQSTNISINPKKLKQVKNALLQMCQPNHKGRILVLSGPAGSSKSTVVKCLARELHTSQNKSSGIRPLSVIEYFDSSLDAVYQPEHFRDFMEGCRYRSGQNSSVILIEELPNVFHDETLRSFRKCLREWAYSEEDLPPVVLCITEVDMPGERENRGYYTIDNNLTAETLLGREMLFSGISAGLIERIKFLPIAKTFIKKSLDSILVSERIRLPKTGADFMTSLYESGDIRSLISNLEFWLLKGFQGDFSRESQISLFYALGKVIHSSSKSKTNQLEEDFSEMDSVMDQFSNMSLLHLGLLENFHIYNGLQIGIEAAGSIVDSLSINDTWASLGYDEYALRVTRLELSEIPLTSRTLPMKFPRHFKFLKEQKKVRKEVSLYTRYIAQHALFDDVNQIEGYFVPLIKNSFKYRLKYGRRLHLYNRVGGGFKRIYADEDLPTMEEDDAIHAEMDQFQIDIQDIISKDDAGDDSDALSEEIEDSEALDDTLDDTLEDDILNIAAQSLKITEPKRATESRKRPNLDDEGFLDDPELDMLVSQGKL